MKVMKYFGLWYNLEEGVTFSVRNTLGGRYQSVRVHNKRWNSPLSVARYDPNDHYGNRYIGPEVLIEWGKDEVSIS